jgi:hypothetical protein
VVYIHNGVYSAIKSEIMLFVCKLVKLENFIISKLRKAKIIKSFMFSLVCGSLICKLNVYIETYDFIDIYVCMYAYIRWVCTIYIYIYIYRNRKNKMILVSLSDGVIGCKRNKENIREWKNSYKNAL